MAVALFLICALMQLVCYNPLAANTIDILKERQQCISRVGCDSAGSGASVGRAGADEDDEP
eukprot:1156622-Pyramimonas_sp.AAC.1